MIKKITLIFFASFFPKEYDKNRNQDRLEEYTASIKRVQQYLEKRDNWRLLIVENTVDIDYLSSLRVIKDMSNVSLYSSNIGISNKGVGELDMLTHVVNDKKDVIAESEYIVYFSGRHLLSSPYSLDCIEKSESDALISNPDFFYFDGSVVKSEKNHMFNDMFFGMKKDLMVEYSKYFNQNKERMIKSKMNSESLLYEFINLKEIVYESLDYIGLIRSDYIRLNRWKTKRIWHIC